MKIQSVNIYVSINNFYFQKNVKQKHHYKAQNDANAYKLFNSFFHYVKILDCYKKNSVSPVRSPHGRNGKEKTTSTNSFLTL